MGESSTPTPHPVCAKEAFDLLNCVVEPFDRDRCLRLLDALRACVLEKKVKKFLIVERNLANEAPNNKSKS